MNKATKAARFYLRKTKRAVVIERMRTQPGSTQLRVQQWRLDYGTQSRKTRFAKVARNGFMVGRGNEG